MKAASGPLLTLLNSGAYFQMCDLWEITLNGGGVIRWTDADINVSSGGHTYVAGPLLDRGTTTEKVGLEVATLDVTITANADDLINGTPVIPFIAKRGFDGANVRLLRAFMTDWDQPVVGTVLRFAGRITSITSIAGNQADVTVSAWTVLLNVNMPANLYQVACLHSVYDAGCALDPATFAVSGHLTGTPTALAFSSSLSTTLNDFAQGRIIFTSGVNAGVSATVKSNDGAGGFVLIRALPAVPSAGDAFTAYPGCDLTMSRCLSRFNNLGRLKATPFTPTPETVFG
jgi:uncharacterized phage protein (TIGR02218 family)